MEGLPITINDKTQRNARWFSVSAGIALSLVMYVFVSILAIPFSAGGLRFLLVAVPLNFAITFMFLLFALTHAGYRLARGNFFLDAYFATTATCLVTSVLFILLLGYDFVYEAPVYQ